MTCDERLIADLQAFTIRMKMDQAGRILRGIGGSGRAQARRDYERKLCQLSYSVKSESPSFLKASMAADGSSFKAYASVFGVRDSQDDIVVRGAFDNSIRRNAGKVLLLWQHDIHEPIGSATNLKEDHHGLIFEGQLNLGVRRGKDAAELLRKRDVDAFSIGYRVAKDGSQMRPGGIRELRELELMEISVVSFGANDRARLA